jgi:hypothetical protein
VELKNRKNGEKIELSVEDVLNQLTE